MSRITMQNFKEPYVALLREGTTEEPYVDITETVKIVPMIEESSLAPARKPIAILREIPVDTYGVSATVKGDEDIELIEIKDSLTKPDATHFKVDYTNGRVYLSDDYKTGTIEFTYKGRGVICVTAQRVIVDIGGDANNVSTLADIIDMQLSELNVGNLNDLLTTDKDYVVNAINEVYTNAVNILSDLNAHKIDYLNPHQTTKEQVELGNVDNTSDINKPVSIAQKTYIDDADSILQDQVDALRGSFIYIGSINLNTVDVTQELLSARALEIMGGTTLKLGWVLVDNEKHEWYYNANITTWIDFEQPNIYQASNSIYGIVKGDGTDVSISDGIITVNNAGNASNLGGVAADSYATKEYVDANGGTVILLAVTDIAPAICAIGDVYFNTTTKLLYDCEVINTWGIGYAPNELKIYIDGSTNVSYYYNGDTLAMTGGDEIYIGEGEIVDDNIKLIVDTEFIETKATEVINSIDVNSSVMAPSVTAVNNMSKTKITTFDSIADVISGEEILFDGMIVETKGYYVPEDMGHGKYIVIEDDLSADIDGGLVIELVANTKYIKLIQTDCINPNQFGAKGDGTTDDTTAVQNAINSGRGVKFVGRYAITHLEFPYASYYIEGQNQPLIYIGDGTDEEVILFKGHHSIINNIRISNTTSYEMTAIRYSSSETQYAQFNYFNGIAFNYFELCIYYGLNDSESINVPQSENYINNLKCYGCNRVIKSNQPNGRISISDSELVATSTGLVTYTGDTIVAECTSGNIAINNSGINCAGVASGYGIKGSGFDISDCNMEVAGYAYYLNGFSRITNVWNGYHSTSSLPFVTIVADGSNTSYLVILDSILFTSASSSSVVSFIKNLNNSYATVLVSNCRINGNIFNENAALNQCFGNITNTYRDNSIYLDCNVLNINKDNYKNYILTDTGTATVTDNTITIAGASGIHSVIEGKVSECIEFVSDLVVASGSVSIYIDIYQTDGTTLRTTKSITSGNLTTVYLNRPLAYKYKIILYSTNSTSISFTKMQIRGNNIINTNLLT